MNNTGDQLGRWKKATDKELQALRMRAKYVWTAVRDDIDETCMHDYCDNAAVVHLSQQLIASKTTTKYLSMRASWLHHLAQHEKSLHVVCVDEQSESRHPDERFECIHALIPVVVLTQD